MAVKHINGFSCGFGMGLFCYLGSGMRIRISDETARSFERGVRRDGTTAGAVIKGGAS